MFHCLSVLLLLVGLAEKFRQLSIESFSFIRFNDFPIAFNRARFDKESIMRVFINLALEMEVSDELSIVIVYALHYPTG